MTGEEQAFSMDSNNRSEKTTINWEKSGENATILAGDKNDPN